MGDKAFLVSNEMTIADCYLFWVVMVAPKSGVELPDRLRNSLDIDFSEVSDEKPDPVEL
jgi:glutathione S-transferase